MAIQKQSADIGFQKGLDQKTDANQLPIGRFVSLVNTVFQKIGKLAKRLGFPFFSTSSDTSASAITTFRNQLLTLGVNGLSARIEANNTWSPPTSLAVPSQLGYSISAFPLSRYQGKLITIDMAINGPGNIGILNYRYIKPDHPIYSYNDSYLYIDLLTNRVFGQNSFLNSVVITDIIGPVSIPFSAGNYIGVSFTKTVGGSVVLGLQYTLADLSGSFNSVTINASLSYPLAYDLIVNGSDIYVAATSSTNITVYHIDSSFAVTTLATKAVTITPFQISITYDPAHPSHLFVAYDDGINMAGTFSIDTSGTTLLAPLNFSTSNVPSNISCFAYNNVFVVYYNQLNITGLDGNFFFNSIYAYSRNLSNVTAGPIDYFEGAELSSKPIVDTSTGNVKLVIQHESDIEPTYFLLTLDGTANISTSTWKVLSSFAFENAVINNANNLTLTGSYFSHSNGNVPQISSYNGSFYIPYLVQDEIDLILGDAFVINSAGANALKVTPSTNIVTIEAGNNLIASGSYASSYDGVDLSEQNFFLFPDTPLAANLAVVGTLPDATYQYITVYEYFDEAGNLIQSAPSEASNFVTSATSPPDTGTIVVSFYYLQFTSKQNVLISFYRWSSLNPVFIKILTISNISTPTAVFDFINDGVGANQTGNTLYTIGGVVENIQPPASNIICLYRARAILVDAEDPNVLWYSKNIIQGEPVEFSDLFTILIPSNYGDQKSTSGVTALGVMDDKLIIFNGDKCIYYMVFTGPDNTGANNDIQDPLIISASVSCSNQNSLVLIPNGLLFQSDKGFWLLDRSLSVSYLGAPAENYNGAACTSAQQIPGTTYVSFTLNDNTIIYYDYFFNEWGSFSNGSILEAQSSCLYQNQHTLLTAGGVVLQQSTNSYVDNTTALTFSFTTGWINLAGFQGFQLAYRMYLLANYLSAHTLTVSVAYDFDPTIVNTYTISPTSSNVEQWRVNFAKRRCESIQLTVQENITGSGGPSCTISGINLIFGAKLSYPRTLGPSNIVGK